MTYTPTFKVQIISLLNTEHGNSYSTITKDQQPSEHQLAFLERYCEHWRKKQKTNSFI